MGIKYKIERLREDDFERTANSATVMNEIIDAVNAFLAAEGRGGLTITKADAGFIFESNGSGSAAASGSGGTTIISGSTSIYNCNPRYI
jgi:hypothetical protein